MNAERIREYMKAADRPCTSAEVADTLGLDRAKTSRALCDMGKRGIVTVDKSDYPHVWTFVREAMTREERLAMAHKARDAYNDTIRVPIEDAKERRREINRRYEARHRETLREKRRARRLSPEGREKRNAQRRAARAAVRSTRVAVKPAKPVQRVLGTKNQAAIRRIANESVSRALQLRDAPVVSRVETVEEWLARGGHLQQLQSGQVSEANQFKRIGRAG
jgi:hypothetical protein